MYTTYVFERCRCQSWNQLLPFDSTFLELLLRKIVGLEERGGEERGEEEERGK